MRKKIKIPEITYVECLVNRSDSEKLINLLNTWMTIHEIYSAQVFFISHRYPSPLSLFPEAPLITKSMYDVSKEKIQDLTTLLDKTPYVKSFLIYRKEVIGNRRYMGGTVVQKPKLEYKSVYSLDVGDNQK